MLFIRSLLVALIFSGPFFSQISDASQQKATTPLQVASHQTNDIYILRGFGDFLSRGLDTLSKKLIRRGLRNTIAPHNHWKRMVHQILANRKAFGQRPIVLIGHSLGANSILLMAQELKKHRVSISYMVTFAATNTVPVSSNVKRLTNYYFKTNGWGVKIKPAKDFKGILENRDFSNKGPIGHFNIEKQSFLHDQVIENVLRYFEPKI